MMRIRNLALVLFFLPAAAPAMEFTERELFAVEVAAGSHLVYTQSFEFFSRNPAMGVFQLGGQWLPAGFERRLAVDARFGRSGTSARSLQALDASLGVTLLSAGASYRHPLLERLYGVGRLAAGAEHTRVRIDDGAGAILRGGAWAPVLEATAGVELLSPVLVAGPVERHVALRLEGGFGWRPFGAHVGPLTRDLDETDPPRIETVPVDPGRLDLTGWGVRGVMAYRF